MRLMSSTPNDRGNLCAAQRVAVIDGCGASAEVSLSWRDADGEHIMDIDWPPSWPQYMTAEALEAKGFRVIVA